MSLMRNAALLCAVVILSACGYGTDDKYASDAEVAKFQQVSQEQPYLMLMTMISNKSGRGGHSSLVINGSQTVMYDPAGRWFNSHAPERHDLLYGVNDNILKLYRSFHARDTHHLVSQKIYVTSEIAEQALAAAKVQGRALDATCAINTVAILNQLEGFKGVKSTYFPEKLMKRFGELPNVQTDKYFETDTGKN